MKDRWLAYGLEVMLLQNKNLHVAFIDSMPQGSSASVMVRGMPQGPGSSSEGRKSRLGSSSGNSRGLIQEVYRVRLPRNPYTGRAVVIGEGKPENQNHATIFAFGESLQAIDMNQDGCLAEAFKMRNLLTVRALLLVSKEDLWDS